MNTRILTTVAIAAISSQAFAMSHSGWGFSASYGILMPTDSKSTWTEIKANDSNGASNNDLPTANKELKLKNVNFFDIGLSHSKSGFGLMYSSTAKDAKFEPTATATSDNDKFVWKYKGYFATYNHPLGQMLDMNLAVGSVKQTLANTAYTATEIKATNSDLGARVGIGAFYNLSKEAALKLSVSYQYFKEFTSSYTSGIKVASAAGDPASKITSATPKFDASGLAGAISLVYSA